MVVAMQVRVPVPILTETRSRLWNSATKKDRKRKNPPCPPLEVFEQLLPVEHLYEIPEEVQEQVVTWMMTMMMTKRMTKVNGSPMPKMTWMTRKSDTTTRKRIIIMHAGEN
jgi:hypothetical protein